MNLILAGGWIGKENFLRAKIRGVHFAEDPGFLEVLDKGSSPSSPRFVVISYDMTESLLGVRVKKSGLPPLIVAELEDLCPAEELLPESSPVLEPTGMSLDREGFTEAIGKVKAFIEAGDVYQINLTSRIDFALRGSPLDLFLTFYSRQEVPFAFYLDAGDFFIISGSMELFLNKKGKRIESRPIKGTGGRAEDILTSQKERAENLMITDMMRNDLGRVAEPGTVRVEELFALSSYRTLSHMHSTVSANTEKGFAQILRATFPPASVTGAPKYRAVQIIDSLEPHPRGYYCGTAGLIFPNGDFTLSVLIRTAFGGGNEVSYFSGCGIVWDSDPDREYEELKLKVKAFYPKATEDL